MESGNPIGLRAVNPLGNVAALKLQELAQKLEVLYIVGVAAQNWLFRQFSRSVCNSEAHIKLYCQKIHNAP